MIVLIVDEGQVIVFVFFGVVLLKLVVQCLEIVGMIVDLLKYIDLYIFVQVFLDCFFQMGMVEQLLMVVVGGMVKEGFIFFVIIYVVFVICCVYDFIYQVIVEEYLNVKICVVLLGLMIGYGFSYQVIEDLVIMCGIFGMVIVDFCDVLEIEQVVLVIVDYQGLVYMCLLCGKVLLVLDKYDYQFELGKVKLLEDGNDVLIIFFGLMIMCVLEVVEKLWVDNIGVVVLYVLIIKLLDEKVIIEQVLKLGCLVVIVENYIVVGGLGEVVVVLLMCKGVCCELDSVGLFDVFLLVGVLLIFYDCYGIFIVKIVEKIKYCLC